MMKISSIGTPIDGLHYALLQQWIVGKIFCASEESFCRHGFRFDKRKEIKWNEMGVKLNFIPLCRLILCKVIKIKFVWK